MVKSDILEMVKNSIKDDTTIKQNRVKDFANYVLRYIQEPFSKDDYNQYMNKILNDCIKHNFIIYNEYKDLPSNIKGFVIMLMISLAKE